MFIFPHFPQLAFGQLPLENAFCALRNPCVVEATCFVDPHAPMIGELMCKCNQGYMGDGRREGEGCADIDECSNGENTCNSLSQSCVNTDGSYYCDCKPGFSLAPDGASCFDIDECAAGASRICESGGATCVNLPGSYKCECLERNHKFNSVSGECLTMDLCNAEGGIHNPCDHQRGICLMTPDDDVQCSCRSGWSMDANNRCLDIDECEQFGGAGLCDPSISKCVNTPGAYFCDCYAELGFKTNPDDPQKCVNLNECLDLPNPCSPNQFCCQDLPPLEGKYRCSGPLSTIPNDVTGRLSGQSLVPSMYPNSSSLFQNLGNNLGIHNLGIHNLGIPDIRHEFSRNFKPISTGIGIRDEFARSFKPLITGIFNQMFNETNLKMLKESLAQVGMGAPHIAPHIAEIAESFAGSAPSNFGQPSLTDYSQRITSHPSTQRSGRRLQQDMLSSGISRAYNSMTGPSLTNQYLPPSPGLGGFINTIPQFTETIGGRFTQCPSGFISLRTRAQKEVLSQVIGGFNYILGRMQQIDPEALAKGISGHMNDTSKSVKSWYDTAAITPYLIQQATAPMQSVSPRADLQNSVRSVTNMVAPLTNLGGGALGQPVAGTALSQLSGTFIK